MIIREVSLMTRVTMIGCYCLASTFEFSLQLICTSYYLIVLLHMLRALPEVLCEMSHKYDTKVRLKFRLPEDPGHSPHIMIGVNKCVQYNGTPALVAP